MDHSCGWMAGGMWIWTVIAVLVVVLRVAVIYQGVQEIVVRSQPVREVN